MIKKKSSSGLQVLLWIFAIVIAAGGFAVFKFGLPMFIDKQADKELLKAPVNRQIARWEPDAYAQMKREMIASMQRGDPPAVAQSHVRKIVEKVANKYMKTADDIALIDYIKVTVDEIRQVNDRDSSAAFDMLFNIDSTVGTSAYIDKATQQRDLDALAEVIRSGVAKEASPQDDQRAMQLLRGVMTSMRNDYGEQGVLALSPAHSSDKAKSVQLALEFYKRLLSLRSDQAAKVLRLVLSKAG
ncbi:MAG: hypothetical protein M3041_02190 [Acidobacteriota bacterium]|nr:hypothetical protein [Acidobacteriota bacterium]